MNWVRCEPVFVLLIYAKISIKKINKTTYIKSSEQKKVRNASHLVHWITIYARKEDYLFSFLWIINNDALNYINKNTIKHKSQTIANFLLLFYQNTQFLCWYFHFVDIFSFFKLFQFFHFSLVWVICCQ